METLVITPKEVNNQYIIDIPDFLRDNKYDLKVVVHYSPRKKKTNRKKSDELKQMAGIFANSEYNYETTDIEWYEQ